jgi:hypothetical protein
MIFVASSDIALGGYEIAARASIQKASGGARLGAERHLSQPPGELCASIRSVAKKKERHRTNGTDRVHHHSIGDEVRINHQSQTAEHHLPEVHPFTVNEANETDGTEQQIADEIGGA